MMANHVHEGQPMIELGASPEEASQVIILLHGRGAKAESLRSLVDELASEGRRFLLPQAGLNRWYPSTAFGPLEANEPDLSSALARIDALVQQAQEQGFSTRQIALGGFSQGACLAAEYAARNPQRYAALLIFSGALIGPPDQERQDSGDLAGTPVLIGGSDVDPWVSHDLMVATAQHLERMGAVVEHRTYSGMGHSINQDELDRAQAILAKAGES